MTPEEARRLLDGTTPGPWEWADGKDDGVEYDALRGHGGVNALRTQDAEEYASWIHGTDADKALAAAAPTLAAMVAGMREEWGVSWDEDPSGNSRDWGFATRAAAERWEKANRRYGPGRGHAVRRYVTEPEEA